jgi:hypothetical protein
MNEFHDLICPWMKVQVPLVLLCIKLILWLLSFCCFPRGEPEIEDWRDKQTSTWESSSWTAHATSVHGIHLACKIICGRETCKIGGYNWFFLKKSGLKCIFLQNLRVPCPGPSLQGSFLPVLYPLPRLRSNGCCFNLIMVDFGLQYLDQI